VSKIEDFMNDAAHCAAIKLLFKIPCLVIDIVIDVASCIRDKFSTFIVHSIDLELILSWR